MTKQHNLSTMSETTLQLLAMEAIANFHEADSALDQVKEKHAAIEKQYIARFDEATQRVLDIAKDAFELDMDTQTIVNKVHKLDDRFHTRYYYTHGWCKDDALTLDTNLETIAEVRTLLKKEILFNRVLVNYDPLPIKSELTHIPPNSSVIHSFWLSRDESGVLTLTFNYTVDNIGKLAKLPFTVPQIITQACAMRLLDQLEAFHHHKHQSVRKQNE